MKKIITLLTLFLLPLSAQALVIGSGTAVTGRADAGTDITHTMKTGVDENVQADGTGRADSNVANDSADEMLSATSSARVDSNSVKTDADLVLYSDSIASANENVVSVDTESKNAVAVAYSHPVRLFGLIPIHITSVTSAALASDGSAAVTTTFPWWKAFVTGVGKTNDKVDSEIKATAAAYLTASTTAHQKALLAESIVATLNADAGVSLLGK